MSRKTERMNRAIGAYFQACDATRERRALKNGGTEERQIPYTLFGLARAAKMSPEALRGMGLVNTAEQTDGTLEIVLDDTAGRYAK